MVMHPRTLLRLGPSFHVIKEHAYMMRYSVNKKLGRKRLHFTIGFLTMGTRLSKVCEGRIAILLSYDLGS